MPTLLDKFISADEQARLSESDYLDLYFNLQKDFYRRRPVPIETFIKSNEYLGSFFKNTPFLPFWLNYLKQVFPNEFSSPHYELIWDLPIGSGKSLTGTVVILYEIYKLSCLKNPNSYYGLAAGTPIVFMIFSTTRALSTNVNWEYFENLMSSSEYFLRNCPLPTGGKLKSEESVTFPNGIMINLGSRADHALGQAVFGGILDEANFQREKSEQARESYRSIKRRRSSRFMQYGGAIPGKLLLLSSPKKSTDFVEEQIKLSKDNENVSILRDVPIWEILRGSTRDRYTGKTFRLFMGNNSRDPFILEDESQLLPGETDSDILEVPVEHFDEFKEDLLSAIRDIAGRPASGAYSFLSSRSKIYEAASMPHRFTKEEVELDFYDPEDTLLNYFDRSCVEKIRFPEAYRFIHLDVAETRDRYSVASLFALEDVEGFGQNTGDLSKKERKYFVDFMVYIKAKNGQEIPFYKVKDFILYLKKSRYPIMKVSADAFQSTDILQQFKLARIPTEKISVDRTTFPYNTLKQILYKGNILVPKVNRLIKELEELVYDGKKIDHPANGSKDGADAITGALWACVQSNSVSTASTLFDGMQSPAETPLESLYHSAMNHQSMSRLSRQVFMEKQGYI
jgi:hypothetical protein